MGNFIWCHGFSFKVVKIILKCLCPKLCFSKIYEFKGILALPIKTLRNKVHGVEKYKLMERKKTEKDGGSWKVK